MSVSTEPFTSPPPRNAAHKAWSHEEDAALQAAVERHLAEHRFLDWDVIAETIPGRTASSVEAHYYVLQARPTATVSSYSKPRAVAAPTVRRPCLRCRAPFESMDRKRNWICESCKRSLGENPFAEARVERHAAEAA
jgi:hypothetical protein